MLDLNWGFVQDGGTFESLMHGIIYAEDPGTVLFGRPGKDAGQDARSSDGAVIYQAKYRQNLSMDGAVQLALAELEYIKKYRKPEHANYAHWQNASRWILVANILTNPNDDADWRSKVVPAFQNEGLLAEYWGIKILEGKLAKLPHIREVFFNGENRILVGLKEAYDRLTNECIGSDSLNNPLVGRTGEMQSIQAFIGAVDKRVLPIVGVAGIGKSRLMYESVATLAQTGWRVFWALPEAMSRSSKWFQFLNSNQPTCVVIDDPFDPGLLAAIIEQLAPIERRNWKVIVGCRSSHSEMFKPFQRHSLLASSLNLVELSEELTKELLKANLHAAIPEAQIHIIHQHTGGNPGWLCLVAELFNRHTLREFPQSVDGIASAYVADSISKFNEADTKNAETLLRYMALWRTLSLHPNAEEEPQAKFLAAQGLPDSDTRRLLGRLAEMRIVRNWGIGKRLFAIQPLIVREHILSEWLFSPENGGFCVNAEGKRIIDLLIKGRIPAVPLVLRSLSHLTRSRLDLAQGYSFVRPVFDELRRIASAGTVIDQDNLLTLVETLGASDPESALDVCKIIRENAKPAIEIQDQFWGKASVTHDSVLVKLPWTLFKIAAFIQNSPVAQRYLEEFRALLTLESNIQAEFEGSKKPTKVLEQMLRESKNAVVYAGPASKIIEQEIDKPDSWPFVGILLECLIYPEREYTEWTAQFTLTFTKYILTPKSRDWDEAVRLRRIAFDALRTSKNAVLRPKIWRILSESHQEFHRLIMHERAQGAVADEYMALLVDDLSTSASLCEQPPILLEVGEIVAARSMWSWYLDYGKSEKLVNLAKSCEAACTKGSIWRPQDFFRFDTDEALQPETRRIAAVFRNAVDESKFAEFFSEAKAYLDAARSGGEDMADSIRVLALADAVVDVFQPPENVTRNPLSLFVENILQDQQTPNELAWAFAVRLCQRYLLRIKNEHTGTDVAVKLHELLEMCHDKARFLFGIYSNPHPLNTGALTLGEFDCIFANDLGFKLRQEFILLGVFAPSHWDVVKNRLLQNCRTLNGQTEELSACVTLFLRMLHLTALRYGQHELSAQITWILENVLEHGLDGGIFGMYEFKWLREHSNFTLSASELVEMIRGRIQLEQSPKVYGSFRTLPFEFQILEWCKFDLNREDDAKAFEEFCSLALENGFVALHYMPKFMAQIDPSGILVASFVRKYLQRNPSLSGDELARLAFISSAYADSTDAWAHSARLICEAATSLDRQHRERVYMGLARKETGVLSSAPGEVPQYYFDVRDMAARMLSQESGDSPLRGYREWALRRAEADLQFEQQRSEEVQNG